VVVATAMLSFDEQNIVSVNLGSKSKPPLPIAVSLVIRKPQAGY
jgi:hypothetical protein